MNQTSETAGFIAARIDESSKSHQQIALEAVCDTGVDVAGIETGAIKLSIAQVGPIAKALNADPVELLTICMQEYFPETWESISPFLDAALTSDELSIVKALRPAARGPYVMSLTREERSPLYDFIEVLHHPHLIH